MATLWQAFVLLVNVRLGWKLLTVANILDYFDTAIITAVERLIVQAPDLIHGLKRELFETQKLLESCWTCTIKLFMKVINGRADF